MRNEPKAASHSASHSESRPATGAWHLRAALTDVQFWVPLVVLLAGLALLAALH